jgi:hypothetical protein
VSVKEDFTMNRSLLIFILLVLFFGANAQKKFFTEDDWAFSGEMLGTALAISFQGEYIFHHSKFDLSLRTGIGRTNLFHDEGDAWSDNLTFPHILSISKKLGRYTPLMIEFGTGGALDLFEMNRSIIVNGNWQNEKYINSIYRPIPLIFGLRQVNSHGYQWRYFVSMNIAPNHFAFPMAGFSFGGIL